MSHRRIYATTLRLARQLRRDRRTIAMILVLPALMLALLYCVYWDNNALFERFAPIITVIFPMFILLVVTSVALQRERSSGKLERLMTTRLRPAELISAYALTLIFFAVLQALILMLTSHYILNISSEIPLTLNVTICAVSGFVGMSMGLFGSAFARTEFQAVQLIPVMLIPQIFLCGLLVDRDDLPEVLHTVSHALPLSYAVEAVKSGEEHGWSGNAFYFLIICTIFGMAFLIAAALTMPRKTS